MDQGLEVSFLNIYIRWDFICQWCFIYATISEMIFLQETRKEWNIFLGACPQQVCKASDPLRLSVGGDDGSQSRDPVLLPLESPGVGLGAWLKWRFLGSSPELLKQQLLRLGPGNLHVTSSLNDSSTCLVRKRLPCTTLQKPRVQCLGPLRLSIPTFSLNRLEEVRPREGKWLMQGHTAKQWQGWDTNQGPQSHCPAGVTPLHHLPLPLEEVLTGSTRGRRQLAFIEPLLCTRHLT